MYLLMSNSGNFEAYSDKLSFYKDGGFLKLKRNISSDINDTLHQKYVNP